MGANGVPVCQGNEVAQEGIARGSDEREGCADLGHADPRMTAEYAHVVDVAKKNPALFIPVKVR